MEAEVIVIILCVICAFPFMPMIGGILLFLGGVLIEVLLGFLECVGGICYCIPAKAWQTLVAILALGAVIAGAYFNNT
jgi:hypothetical protein